MHEEAKEFSLLNPPKKMLAKHKKMEFNGDVACGIEAN